MADKVLTPADRGLLNVIAANRTIGGQLYNRINNGIEKRIVKLLPAEVNALFTTPKEIIPAPGAGKIVIPITAIFRKNGGTTGYTKNSATLFSLVYSGESDTIARVPLASFIDQNPGNEDTMIVFCQSHYTAQVSTPGKVNTAIDLENDVADMSGGDQDLYVKVFYRTVEVP